jgi:hypothetical protein
MSDSPTNPFRNSPESQAIATALLALPVGCPKRTAATIALENLAEVTDRRNRILELVKEALAQLRLDMKYLIFDLEATRRERDQWKAKYQNPGPNGL